MRVLLPPLWWKTMRALNIGPEGELKKHVKILDATVMGVIDSRLGLLAQGDGPAADVGTDLLGLFIQAYSKKNETPTATNLRDSVINFIIAGRDTTAWTMTAVTLLLCQHPEVKAKCLAEIEEECAPGPLSPTYEEIEKLSYLEAVILEALRIYPSVPAQFKFALGDDAFPDGSKISKGDCLVYSSFVMGRLESVWGKDAAE